MSRLITDLFPNPLIDRLRAGTEHFVVTGATGWFGTVTVALLDTVFGPQTPQRVSAYASTAREVRMPSGRTVHAHPLAALVDLPPRDGPMVLLHFAFAVPGRGVGGRGAGPRSSLTNVVADAISALRPDGLCFPSSGAVHGHTASPMFLEYARQKADDEVTLRGCCAAFGTRIVIPRVFSVGGPLNPEPERYLLGELVQRTIAGEPLDIRSPNRVYRSYVALTDVLGLTLMELLRGERDELTFDAAGDEAIEAAVLADRVRQVLGRPDLPIRAPAERPRDGDGTESGDDDRYVGDPTALRALASHWDVDLAPLDDIIRQSALP